MGPDHVQITKVNWKNIQEYFKIFAKISPTSLLQLFVIWLSTKMKIFVYRFFFQLIIYHLWGTKNEEFIIFFFGLIFATFDDFIKFSQLNYKFRNQVFIKS